MPSRHVSNDQPPYCDIPNLPSNWWRFWGIEKRYLLDRDKGETALENAVEASNKAIEISGLNPEDIDVILCNSTCFVGWSDDYLKAFPRFSHQLKSRINCEKALGIDVEQECITFLISLQIAEHYISSGLAKNILICSSEYISNVLDFTDLSSTTFGDGTVAAVVSYDKNQKATGLLSSSYGSNADFYDIAMVKWGTPVNADPNSSKAALKERYWSYFTLDKNAPMDMQKFVPQVVPSAIREALKKSNLSTEEIDYYVFHQPSKILVDLWANNIGIDYDKYLLTLKDYGCMVSVSMPITLYESIKLGKINPGDNIVIAGAATGWGYGAQVWKIDNQIKIN